ncbi:MAG: YggU family protein [Sedimentisphaerales bacterium]|nr:YggU family protein [Sedimentisphaerales bacterium]
MECASAQPSGDTFLLNVKVVPGSSKTAIVGFLNGMLKIKVATPPEKGKANQTLIAFLSKQLGIRKKDITIISGQTSPVKQLAIRGRSGKDIRSALTTKEKGKKGRKAT